MNLGSRGEWLVVGLTLAGAVLALTVGRGAGGSPLEAEVEVTIVPIDELNLACAGAVAGARCAFDDQGQPVGLSTPPLRPYITTGGEAVAVAGLMESPRVMAWLERARGTQTRVRVRCPVVLLSRWVRLGVRFRPADAFDTDREVPAFVAHDCEVVP